MIDRVKIKLDNTEFEFHFGLGFLGELLETLDMSIDEAMQFLDKNPFKAIPIVMHASAKYGAERKGQEFKLTKFDIVDKIDKDGGIGCDGVAKFLNAFTKSMTKDVPPVKEEKSKVEAGKKNS